jgi:hypothetical protein
VTAGTAFELLGRAFGIATPGPDLAAQVARLMPSLARPLEPGGADEVWTLHEESGAWIVQAPALPPERFPDLGAALEAVEFLVTSRLLSLLPTVPQLHAAGAVFRDRAVIAVGESGAGKSSIALQWSRAGIPVLGDDVVLLDREDRAVAFPRHFSVARARLEAAGAVPDAALSRGRADDELRYDPASPGGGGWAPPAPVSLIAVIQRAAGLPLSVESIAPAHALTLLLGALHQTGSPPTDCFPRLAALAERSRAVRVTFDDAGEAARVLASLA